MAFHPIDIAIGAKVKALRLERGLKQGDLARALKLTFQQVQKYESGANRISGSKLWETARYFTVPVSDLFPDDGVAHLADRGPTPIEALASSRQGQDIAASFAAMNDQARASLQSVAKSLAQSCALKAAA